MKPRVAPVTLVSAAPPPEAVSGLAALAFGSASIGLGEGKHLAFLPLESLELDLDDPEQRDFGDYELIEQLGQGGMGVVYRARQKSLQREVALKLLSAGPWASPEFIARFTREAQSAARLQHPNIVAIYEIGAHADLNFFSMALVRGQSLAQRLDRDGAFAPRDAARLVERIAEALDYAHRLGILHLDLKPANILIDEHGEPQVADFGLAKRLDESLASEGDEVSGTPSYMAPEQATARSQRIGVATDIYGLGAILHELLTGRPPYLGATPRHTLEQVVTRPVPSPRAFDRRIPEDLDAICMKCLAKDPAQRYVTARGLAEDLSRFLEGRAVSVRPLSALQRLRRWARREPRVAFAAGAALFALIAGLGATSLQWRRAEDHASRARERSWVLRAQAAQAALTAGDGFAALRPLVANLVEMEAQGAAADADVERQRIGTILANAPTLIDLLQLESGLSVHALAIAPDGAGFAVTLHDERGERAVRAYDAATGLERWTTSTSPWSTGLPWKGMPHGWLRYSPDGSRLLVTMMHQSPFPFPRVADAMPLDARDGTLLKPPGAGDDFYDLVASDDARHALARWRTDPSHRFPDRGRFYAIDGWTPIGPMHALTHELQTDSWLPAPDGSVWLGTSGSRVLTLFELGSLAVRWRIELPGEDLVRGWRFSGDGARLAIGTAEGRVLLVDVASGASGELPAAPTESVRWLEFSADGATLAARAENGTIAAWDVATRKPRAAPIADADGEEGAVRVVGDTLYSATNQVLRSWTLPPLAQFDNDVVSAPVQLRNRRYFLRHGFDVHAPGRLLAAAGSDGRIGLWRLPPPALRESRAAPLPTDTQHFDGRHLVAVGGHRVQLRDVLTEAPRSAPFDFPDPVRVAELSHDGRRLVVVAGRTVRVIDPVAGTLVGAPIVLPQSPLRADIAGSAPVLVLGTGEYEGDRFGERLHVVDLERGVLRGDAVRSEGLVDMLRIDPAGRRALVSQYRLADGRIALAAIDLGGGSACGELAPEGFNHLRDAVFGPDPHSAWIDAWMTQRRTALVRYDLARCTEVERVVSPGTSRRARLAAAGRTIVAHRHVGGVLTVFGADGRRRDVPGMVGDQPIGSFALSRDGRRVALASRKAVQLVDLERGEYLSGLLAAPLAGDDGITKVMLSPDADTILARSFRGRWLYWRVPRTTLGSGELAQLASLLDPRGPETGPDPDALAALRPVLRASDVAPPAAAVAPAAVVFAPDPGAEPDPRFVPVDLAPGANVLLHTGWPRRGGMGGDTPTLPPGPQRLQGIDWHVEHGVQLSWGGAAASLHPTQRSSPVIPVPAVAARRVHLLMRVHIPIDPRNGHSLAATVALVDAEGREHALPIRMVRDVVSSGLPEMADPGARIAWLGVSGADLRQGEVSASETSSQAYAVSLDVPPGLGPIHGLRLETRDGPMEAPLFYAVTLERDPPLREPAAGAVQP